VHTPRLITVRRTTTAALGLAGAVGIGVLGIANIVPNPAASADPTPVCAAGTCTETFDYTGASQVWTVPSGVSSETFALSGAVGGAAIGGPIGGLGATVVGTLSLGANFTITINVGGAGGSETAFGHGGFNGGGDGSEFTGGAGGGATDIRVGGTDVTDRVLVAGGGGGGGANGATNLLGCNAVPGGNGGAADQDGTAGVDLVTSDATLPGGGAGLSGDSITPGHGGAGGHSPGVFTDCGGTTGLTALSGATGPNGDNQGQGGGINGSGGGGGGGGYIGGGAGGGGAGDESYFASLAGGGGGSSYGGGVSDYTLENDTADIGGLGNGQAVITYADPGLNPVIPTTTPTTSPSSIIPPPPPVVTPTPVATPVLPVQPSAAPAAGSSAPTTPVLAGTDPSSLAFTGLNVMPLLLSGLSLILIGSSLVGGLSIRRRRTAAREA
jgi:hypothetical protein